MLVSSGLRCAVAALTCVALIGCPGGPKGGAPAAAQSGGAATPEEAFARAKQASAAGEWRTYYDLLAPTTRDEMLGGIVFASAMLAGFSKDPTLKTKVEDLAKKHGVREAEKREPSEMDRVMVAAVAGVADKPACFADFMAWIVANNDEGATLLEMGVLDRVTITGDTAQGIQVTTKKGGREESPIVFQRVDGRWFLDLTKS